MLLQNGIIGYDGTHRGLHEQNSMANSCPLHKDHSMQSCAGLLCGCNNTASACREEANLGEVIYARASIAGLPEAHASRKERFSELDDLQPGWEVELRGRKGGTTVDAFFFSPTGMSASMLPPGPSFLALHCVFCSLPPGLIQNLSL